MCYVRKIDVFQRSFVLVFTNGTNFPAEIFLQDLYIKNKKRCTVDVDDSYICYVSKFDVFQSSFVLVFTNGTTFP